MSNTLNVIFHGLWIFIERKDLIEVIAPRIPFHVYQYGEWLAEHPLPEGVSQFTGVTGGDGTFDHQKNLVFIKPAISGGGTYRFATLRFPKPRYISSERTAKLEDRHFSSTPGPNVERNQVSEVQILQYDIPDFRGVKLNFKSIPLTPIPPVASGASRFANCHFWADSPVPETAPEGEEASYIACVHVLGSNVWLKDSPEVENDSPTAQGVEPAELLPLNERHTVLREHVGKWRDDPSATGQTLLKGAQNVSGRPNCDSMIATE